MKPTSVPCHAIDERYWGSLLWPANGCTPREPARDAPNRTNTTMAVCHSGASKGLRLAVGFGVSDRLEVSGSKLSSSYNGRFAILVCKEQGIWLWKKSSSYRRFVRQSGSFRVRCRT